ncbi:MAG: SGNH/GDSL hydrolase family protein [Acidobacteria bacterium]|nr:SGNH/GDSL hydrolase family protein [Acidobacteriota bacterium]
MTSSFYRGGRAGLLLLAALVCSAGCAYVDEQARKGVGMSVEDRASAPVVYVALGDSTGVGVGARHGGGYVARVFHRIERVRPGSRLVNLCVSGATTTDVLRGQISRVEGARPTLVTLGIGINDLTRNVSVEQFARNYEEIVARLKESAAGAPIVLTNIPDISFAPAVPAFMRDEARRRLLRYNERIAEISERHGLMLVDACGKSHEVVPSHPEFFSPDGFHPSEEGYEFWAVSMWPTVKEAIGE